MFLSLQTTHGGQTNSIGRRIKALGKPKAPAPPDPKETSAAATGTNIGTAVANAWMQNPSEYTPDGNTRVEQTGSKQWTDSYTGKTYDIPTFSRYTELSPQQQAIKSEQDAASLGLSKLANNQTAFLQDYMGKPFDFKSLDASNPLDSFALNNETTEARLLELGRKRLDPALAQQDEALRSRLASQGIKAGSDAYDREMMNQGQNRNDAINQLLLTGRQQAANELLAERGQRVNERQMRAQELLTQRNQPINEITALLSGSQVQMPQFMGANIGAIPTTDVAGLINENFNQKMSVYQQQMAQRNNLMGGLFGLAGKVIGLSDERAKTDIKPVGEMDGHRLYSYRYKKGMGDGKQHVGVMAQEVEKTRPDAVTRRKDGMRQVHYGKLFGLGERMAA